MDGWDLHHKLHPMAVLPLIQRLKDAIRHHVFRGDMVYCPACGRAGLTFIPFGNPPRPHAQCPFCTSLERTRALKLVLDDMGLPKAGSRVLHVAPEPGLAATYRRRGDITYIMGDRFDPGYSYPKGTVALDLTKIDFPNEHFDLLICSHVLEHVDDDSTAMSEIFRVLKPGGIAAILVPLIPGDVKDTLEDPAFNTPELRLEHYGQADHVRFYGTDIAQRLASHGFQVTSVRPYARYGPADVFRYGLHPDDTIFISRK